MLSGRSLWRSSLELRSSHGLSYAPMKSMRVLLCVGAASVVATAQPSQPNLTAAFREVDRVFTEFVSQNHVPGAAWGIVVDGLLAHSASAGYRELATKTPVDADT